MLPDIKLRLRRATAARISTRTALSRTASAATAATTRTATLACTRSTRSTRGARCDAGLTYANRLRVVGTVEVRLILFLALAVFIVEILIVVVEFVVGAFCGNRRGNCGRNGTPSSAVTSAAVTSATVASAAFTSAAITSAAFGRNRRQAQLLTLLAQNSLARELDAVAFNGENLDQDLIAFAKLVLDLLDAVLCDFGDVEQTVGAGEDFDKCAELCQANNLAKVRLADLQGLP